MGEEISEINSYKSIESSNQDRTEESGKKKVIVWSNEQLLYWRRIDEEYVAEPSLTAFRQEIERQRQYAQKEMLQLLNAFLTSEITLEVFNRIFQQKTNGTWNAFHVRGTSGGMFLNKLVKYIPEENHLAQLLRVVLRLPKDTKEGHWRMQIFVQFLEDVIASQQAARIQLQPARVPFFLSVWWHLQETEQWPISYLTVRNVILGEEREPEIEQDPIERYFAFRARFTSLARGLGLISWDMEHLLTWYSQKYAHGDRREGKVVASDVKVHEKAAAPAERVRMNITQAETIKETSHTVAVVQATSLYERCDSSYYSHLQWLLAKLGHKVGCDVWIRSTDHRKAWQHERLDSLSVPSLPILAEPSLQQVIEQIDVLWFLNNEMVAAFEIEQTHTDVSVGLLRLMDVGTLIPTENMYLCVVIPQSRFEKVHLELQRPVFQQQDLGRRCLLISQEILLHQAEHILRWARNLFVIDDLTTLSTGKGNDESLLDHRLAGRKVQKRDA